MINETLKDCDEESDLVKSITILMKKINMKYEDFVEY